MYSICMIDDEYEPLFVRAEFLRSKGCNVATAQNAADGMELAASGSYDLILLDVKMPDKCGFDLCREIKYICNTPIVFLSSMQDTDNQLMGFGAGGADYIAKGCPLDLFWAKVQANIELSKKTRQAATIVFEPLCLDLQMHQASIASQPLNLTNIEFNILLLLTTKPRYVWSVNDIYRKIWGEYGETDSQLVQTHLSRMRRKLEKAFTRHDFIETVWGKGYQFVPMDD